TSRCTPLYPARWSSYASLSPITVVRSPTRKVSCAIAASLLLVGLGQAAVNCQRLRNLLLDVALLGRGNSVSLPNVVPQALNPADEILGVRWRSRRTARNFQIHGATVCERFCGLLRRTSLPLGADCDPAAAIDLQILIQ